MLIFDGKLLGSGYTFLDYGIQNKSSLALEDTADLSWGISRDEIFLGCSILRESSWGYITEAVYRGCIVAAKCRNKLITTPYELFAKEMKKSACCHHRNLVEFIGAVPNHPAIMLVEIMDTTLSVALKNLRVKPNHIHPISLDVAQGLLYLHSIQPNPIIHGNVSACNVLLKASGFKWIAKLSDLASAYFTESSDTYSINICTAPEVQAHQQTVKIDVYSFGVLLVEILTREMLSGSIETRMKSVQSRWPHFVPIITSCTATDPNLRPSIRQVIDQLDTIIM